MIIPLFHLVRIDNIVLTERLTEINPSTFVISVI